MTGKNPQQTGRKSTTDRKKSADTQGVCRYHHGSLKLLHGVDHDTQENFITERKKSIHTQQLYN